MATTLEQMNASTVTCYEVVMPNLVNGFAMERMKEINLSSEDMVKMVENSNRFSYESLYLIWTERAARSMKTDNIALPFWENIARYREERMMETALWQVILSGVLLFYWGVQGIIWMIKHKPTAQTFVHLWEMVCSKVTVWTQKIKEKKKLNKNV